MTFLGGVPPLCRHRIRQMDSLLAETYRVDDCAV
jgi:hypothetical protein